MTSTPDLPGPHRTRGRLRVYLGAAPGVGKTYKMLEEGRRRLERGTDVVVGFVETHGRARTAALLDGFEIVPRRTMQHRGAVLQDMDLDAVLARRPAVALVDELAHTNAPGLRHEKRWEDVEVLLAAGIDVITTVNVQHLESLNDALQRITGVEQRETIPDEVVRRADQIELVDMAPEALRRRITHGNVYPRDRVDAALGNYFRVGNLTALRELALLWVADRVDDELLEYRHDRGIRRPWETRERIVVALTGAPSGEMLIRRAARLAERSRAELIGVHVRRSEGLGTAHADDRLAEHRHLLADLGGRYHEIAGDDPAIQLVAFARGENATQLVLGTSQRHRIDELVHGSVINDAIRASPDIDVHVIAHADAPASGATLALARRGRARSTWRRLPPRRRWTAMALALVGPPVLTLAFVPFRDDEGLPGVLPAYMLLVVATALVGGTVPALVAAVLGFTIGNLALTRPYGTLRITELASVVGLALFLAVAAVVAVLVGRLGARSADAERARAQARALAGAAASVAEDDAVPELLDRLRTLLGLDAVAIVTDGVRAAVAGDPNALDARDATTRVELGESRSLVTAPVVDDADEAAILRAFGDQLVAAIRRNELATTEHEAGALAEIDRFRTALLRSVSHDLRSPLASIKAAASSLQQDDVDWPADARADFLATIIEEGDRLDRIVTNLLDASRLEAGVLAVAQAPVHLDDLVPSVVASVPGAAGVHVQIADGTPAVLADPTLLERVLENVLTNALRHAPGAIEVDTVADHEAGIVHLRVIDHGLGIPPASRPAMFHEFQRLDDHGAGVGLGLAVAHGFVEAMGGALEPTDTPGGGLTMSIIVPIADANP